VKLPEESTTKHEWVERTDDIGRLGTSMRGNERAAAEVTARQAAGTGGAERLLSRLERVTQCAPDRWRSLCPAHESRHRTQSLAVRELSDGTLLVRCHAGCDIGSVVAAVGLELRDLFPRDHSAPADPRRPQRSRHWHTIREAIAELHHEVLICAIAAEDMARGDTLSADDRNRLSTAAQRIRRAIEACT